MHVTFNFGLIIFNSKIYRLCVAHVPRLVAKLDKCTRLQTLFFLKKRSGSYPVSHMAPPNPSVGISVSVCGRSRQCFRSYPRNYTSVWLSAPIPCPSGRWHAVSNANRMPHSPPPPIRYPPAPLPVWLALYPLCPLRLVSYRITDDVCAFLQRKKKRKRSNPDALPS